MSRKEFSDDCQGCRPCLIDFKTMKPLPLDHPVMLAVYRVWNNASLEEKRAFHDFTCNNSREPDVVKAISHLQSRMEFAIKCVNQ